MRVRRTAGAVARLHIEAQPVAFCEHHAHRPDFYFALDWFASLQPPTLVVRMKRPVGQRAFRIKLAVRGAQPAFRHRHLLPLLADFPHVIAGDVDVAHGDEHVHVLHIARHPQHQFYRTGDLGGLGKRRGFEGDADAMHAAGLQHG